MMEEKQQGKDFDIENFMHNVRREAGELPWQMEPELRPLSVLIKLEGAEFILAVYRKILYRDADLTGLDVYERLSRSFIGRIKIIIALYSSPEYRLRSDFTKGRFQVFHPSIKELASSVQRLAALIPTSFRKRILRQRRKESFYFDFESKYREDFSAIYMRMERRYSQKLKEIGAQGGKALDLGCGRGEAIALLETLGFTAFGIDNNPISIEHAKGRGLKASKGDIFKGLRKIPTGSLSVVTAVHVIEHISFDRLWELTEEIWRVLQPGGVLILETPNIRNILVASSDFYRDPTHISHIFPDTLDFLLKREGMFSGESYFFSENEELVPFTNLRLNDLQDYVSISRDMAWIGCKFTET